jgi:hypothetical protein
MWTYNGTAYVTYVAPASTAWFTSGTSNDAGNSKTSNIYRTGRVGIGTNNPLNNLDVVGGFNLRNISGAAGSNYGMEFNTNANSPRMDWIFNGGYIGQFTSDANNFILQNSKLTTGGFRFVTNPGSGGIDRLNILNNGNVGIGTTAPITKLQIQGQTATNTINADAQVLRLSRPGVSSSKWDNIAQFNLGNYSTAVNANTRLDLALNDGATLTPNNIMTWQANGNVGINNTAPSAPLVVQGVTGTGALKLIAPSVTAGDNWWMGFGHGTTSTDANDRARIGVDVAAGGAGRLFFTTGAAGSQTRSMFIDESQRVGIGTSTPSTRLHVQAGPAATNTINADAQVLRLSRTSTSNVKWDNIAQFNLGSYMVTTGGNANATSRLDLALTNGNDNTTLSTVMTWQANGRNWRELRVWVHNGFRYFTQWELQPGMWV